MAAPPVADPAESELASDHAFLCEAVREAGALSLRYFRHDPKAWEKNPGDPVSEADLAVNELLRERLCTRHPDDGWLSEESADDPVRLAKRRVWIVDPIDGTLDGTMRGAKAGNWKSPYHNGRAVLESLRLLKKMRAEWQP